MVVILKVVLTSWVLLQASQVAEVTEAKEEDVPMEEEEATASAPVDEAPAFVETPVEVKDSEMKDETPAADKPEEKAVVDTTVPETVEQSAPATEETAMAEPSTAEEKTE